MALSPEQLKTLRHAMGTGRHKDEFMSIFENRLASTQTALVMKGDEVLRGRCQELMDLLTLFKKAEPKASEE